MARWDTLVDPTNPFNHQGLSDEVESALDYLEAAKADTGVDVVVTSTTDHPKWAASGNLSMHRRAGTDGEGLGLDCRMRQRSVKPGAHLPVYDLLRHVTPTHELIYAFAPDNLRHGQPVPPYAVADHPDHVHWSFPLGARFAYQPAAPDPLPPLDPEDLVPVVVSRTQGGAMVIASDGGVFSVGDAPFYNSLPGIGVVPAAPIVGGDWTPSGSGYWLVGRDGGIFAFGDAPPIDPTDQVFPHLHGRPVVGLSAVAQDAVDVIAFDRSNDGTPYDSYRATA